MWRDGHETIKSEYISFASVFHDTTFTWKMRPVLGTMIPRVGLVTACTSSRKVGFVQMSISRDPEGFGSASGLCTASGCAYFGSVGPQGLFVLIVSDSHTWP
jgi:hypothetical protein